MPRPKKPLPTTRSLQNVISGQGDPPTDALRSIQADVQLILDINKRKKTLETIRPHSASVTPTLNLVLARARDTVRTLTIQLQNDAGDDTQIRTYATIIPHSLAFSRLPYTPGCSPPSFRQPVAWKRQSASQKGTHGTKHIH
jgi:hypothetical protein